jgi:hypothetical protein
MNVKSSPIYQLLNEGRRVTGYKSEIRLHVHVKPECVEDWQWLRLDRSLTYGAYVASLRGWQKENGLKALGKLLFVQADRQLADGPIGWS